MPQDIDKINKSLEDNPSIIAFFASEENIHYAAMQNAHEEYKRERAKLVKDFYNHYHKGLKRGVIVEGVKNER